MSRYFSIAVTGLPREMSFWQRTINMAFNLGHQVIASLLTTLVIIFNRSGHNYLLHFWSAL